MGRSEWSFVGKARPERRTALESPAPFPEVVRHLSQSLSVACYHREPKQRDPAYSRATFCLDVAPWLFDALFNSSTGYRGAYFASPENGLRANRYLTDQISGALRASAKSLDAQVDDAWLVASLSQPSAKAWLGEDVLALCPKCKGGWSTSYNAELQIQNGRWEHSRHVHAKWGCQAPELAKIRLFGGFVDSAHHEWVAGHKEARAEQIWEHGWT
jgi:hypothetical protein